MPPASSRIRALASNEICSSLLFQQLLYYNLYWSPAWLLALGVRCHVKYGRGFQLSDPDIARTVLCIFWMLAEPIRLAAGWYGNLQENVPWLVIFGVLTLVPQTAVCYYLMLAAYVLHMLKAQRRQYYLFEHALQQQQYGHQQQQMMLSSGLQQQQQQHMVPNSGSHHLL
eukprot:gene13897-biopygen15828